MKEIIKFIKIVVNTMSWKTKCFLLYCACNAAISPLYKIFREYAQSQRVNKEAVGGEIFLWIIPLMVIYLVWTHRYEKARKEQIYEKSKYHQKQQRPQK